jgi:hypothetical protein
MKHRTSRKGQFQTAALIALATISFLGLAIGCQSPATRSYESYSYPDADRTSGEAPLAISDVSRMLNAGLDDEIIANQIRAKGMMSPLRSEDVAYLQGAGAGPIVIDAAREASPEPRGVYPGNVVVTSPPPVVIVDPHPPVCIHPTPTLNIQPSPHFSLQLSPRPNRSHHHHGPHW